MQVTVVGGATLDIIVAGASFKQGMGAKQDVSSVTLGAGGGAVNAGLAFQAGGAQVRLVCALGGDAEAEWLRGALRRQGLDLSLVQTVAGEPTGKAVIHLDAEGEARVFAHRGASTKVSPARVGAATPRSELLYVTALSTSAEAELATQLARAGGRLPRLAINPSARQLEAESGALHTLLSLADLICLNEAEARLLARHQGLDLPADPLVDGSLWLGALRRRAGQALLVTLGAKGALFSDAEQTHFSKGSAVQVVSTLGAGDAFGATFACHWMAGAPAPAALDAAQSYCRQVLKVVTANLAGSLSALP